MGCCSMQYEVSLDSPRRFFTREERIEMLKEYHSYLEKEAKGVAEKIDEMKNSKGKDYSDEE